MPPDRGSVLPSEAGPRPRGDDPRGEGAPRGVAADGPSPRSPGNPTARPRGLAGSGAGPSFRPLGSNNGGYVNHDHHGVHGEAGDGLGSMGESRLRDLQHPPPRAGPPAASATSTQRRVAHLAPPHPGHEEQPRDHGVEPAPLEGDLGLFAGGSEILR